MYNHNLHTDVIEWFLQFRTLFFHFEATVVKKLAFFNRSLILLTARVSEDSFTQDSQKFKLC